MFALARTPAKAEANNNPVFATIQYVKDVISTALSPIQSALANLQAQQASQATQINNLQSSTGKSLKVFDANGEELGILVNHTGSYEVVYSQAINRFISLDELGGIDGKTGAYYQSSDCTGTPYEPNSASITNTNNLLPFSPQVFYIINSSDTPATITTGSVSVWNDSINRAICTPNAQTLTGAYQLHLVSLPFSTPVALPLQFKYQ